MSKLDGHYPIKLERAGKRWRSGYHKIPVIPVVGNLLACLKGKIHMGLSTRSPLRLVTTRCCSPADNETRSTPVAATDRGAHNDR